MRAREATTIFHSPVRGVPTNDSVTVTTTQTVAPLPTGPDIRGDGLEAPTPPTSPPFDGSPPSDVASLIAGAYFRTVATALVLSVLLLLFMWTKTDEKHKITGRIVAAYFGGVGFGLVLATIVLLLLLKMFRKKMWWGRGAGSGSQIVSSFEEGEGEALLEKALVATPKGEVIQLPLDDPEGKPMLVGKSEGYS